MTKKKSGWHKYGFCVPKRENNLSEPFSGHRPHCYQIGLLPKSGHKIYCGIKNTFEQKSKA